MPLQSEQQRAAQYFNDMPDNVFSLGRAGSYLYQIDIDDCIKQSMYLSQSLKEGGNDHQFLV